MKLIILPRLFIFIPILREMLFQLLVEINFLWPFCEWDHTPPHPPDPTFWKIKLLIVLYCGHIVSSSYGACHQRLCCSYGLIFYAVKNTYPYCSCLIKTALNNLGQSFDRPECITQLFVSWLSMTNSSTQFQSLPDALPKQSPATTCFSFWKRPTPLQNRPWTKLKLLGTRWTARWL